MSKNIVFHKVTEYLTFILFEGEVISDQIKQNGFWNYNALTICDKILKNSNYGNVIDVGAGFGAFSIPLFLRSERKFTFHCFEPVQTLHNQLCSNLFYNSIDKIHTYQNVISSEDTKKTFKTIDIELSNNHGSFSFVNQYNQIRNIESNKESTYYIKTLDSFEIEDVKLIKISVSGMEMSVLDGAIETIKKSNYPPIFIQCWNTDWFEKERKSIFSRMQKIGYEFYHEDNENLYFFKDIDEADRLQRDSKVLGNLSQYKMIEVEIDIENALNDQEMISKKIMSEV